MIVGMVGKAQSGKDTFAEVLIREGGYTHVAFALELKLDVALFLGIAMAELELRKGEFRATLQAHGERMRREEGITYWIGRVEPVITAILDAHEDVVITDVRYKNEADWVRALGGVLIRRVRTDGVGLKGEQALHSSETELDDIWADCTCVCETIPEIREHARRFLSGEVAHEGGA